MIILSISIAFKTLSPVLRLSGQRINNNIINSIDKIAVIKYTVCKRFKCLKNLNDFLNKNLINLGTSIYVQVTRSIPKLQVYRNHSCFRNFEFRTSISTSVLLCLLPTYPWKVISLVLTSGVFWDSRKIVLAKIKTLLLTTKSRNLILAKIFAYTV